MRLKLEFYYLFVLIHLLSVSDASLARLFFLIESYVCSYMMNGSCQHQKTSKAHCRIHNCDFHKAAHKTVGEIIGRINIFWRLHKRCGAMRGIRDKMCLEHILEGIICTFFHCYF